MSQYTIWNAFYVGQNTATTCWRAGYEMLLRYKAGDPQRARDLPNAAQMAQRGILDNEFPVCAQALGLGGIRYTYFQAIENLEHVLRTWGPVWSSGFFIKDKKAGASFKHIVVVAGIDTDDETVLINDPMRAYAGAKGEGRWWPFSYWANNLNPVPWSCQLWY